MSDCIFCKIINKEIPATIVFESEHVIAINDIHPKAKVHVLVIPKLHASTWNDLSVEDMAVLPEVGLAIQAITQERNIVESGYKVVNNNGKDGGQAVPHMHFHILGGQSIKGVT